MAEENEALLEELGLTYALMSSTQGATTFAAFDRVAALFSSTEESVKTKHAAAQVLSALCSSAAAQVPIDAHVDAMLEGIAVLATTPDDPAEEGESYEGAASVAETLAYTLSSLSSVDPTGARGAAILPKAYATINRILDAELELAEATGFVSEGPAISRANTINNLVGMCPDTGSVDAPDAVSTLIRIVKTQRGLMAATAKGQFAMLSMVMTGPFRGHAGELLELIEMGGHDDLVHTFTTDTELYASDPEGVHAHVEVFLNMPFMTSSTILYKISGKAPEVLAPYADKLLQLMRTETMMASMVFSILKGVARPAAAELYPHVDEIAAKGKSTNGAAYMVAGIFVALGTLSTEIADEMVGRLCDMLSWGLPPESPPSVLDEMTNLKDSVSSNEVFGPYMDKIREFKGSADSIVTVLEDFYAGRSLENVTDRLDTLEERINELNNKVAESCSNFEEVKAYVDANIAEVKDFVGEIAKKLPTPHRLEVTGRIRKTLILHFQCGRSGREYPIESKEWNKWLKVGFTLIQTAQCVIDIGTGNLLDLASTGVDMVKDVYDIYKSADDDEFNSYIQNPFLLSSEQDRLLEKLRDQGFFDVMDYDAQLGAWFLLHPERDGKLPPDSWDASAGLPDAEGKMASNDEMNVAAEAKARENALANTAAGKAAATRAVRELETKAAEQDADADAAESKSGAGTAAALSTSHAAAARSVGAATGANKEMDDLKKAIESLQQRVVELESRPPQSCCTVT